VACRPPFHAFDKEAVMPDHRPDDLAQQFLALSPREQDALLASLQQQLAGGRRPSTGRIASRQPAHSRPQPLPARTRIRSAAGVELGSRSELAEVLADEVNRRSTRDGFVPVASVVADLPSERTLRRDTPEGNTALVASAMRELRRARTPEQAEALTAAGGICAPPTPIYDFFVAATDVRPVRDAFPSFGAERGGVTLIPPPTLSDVAGSISLITAAADAAGGVGAEKACLHVNCGAPRTYQVSAVPFCLEFGNFGARAYPEQVESWVTLATAAQARRAETMLLDAVAANSIAVTAQGALGAGSEVLARLAQLAAGYRSRHRMRADARLAVLLPAWTVDLIRADRTRAMEAPREQTIADTEAWLGAAGLDVAWYLDGKTGGGQAIGTQAAGPALTFPPTLLAYLYAPGTFAWLDGGQLDFGIVRDSTLNSRNDFRLMVESFETLAYLGNESIELALSVCASGERGARRQGGAALICPV
jgi:hypothetical protein